VREGTLGHIVPLRQPTPPPPRSRSVAHYFGSRCTLLSVCARNRTETVRSCSARGSTRQIDRR